MFNAFKLSKFVFPTFLFFVSVSFLFPFNKNVYSFGYTHYLFTYVFAHTICLLICFVHIVCLLSVFLMHEYLLGLG